jgi:hypothetical protein
MDRYLIETPHDEVDCHLVLNEIHSMGYLHNFDWGCDDGVHCGWAIIESESKAQAKMVVPSLSRDTARIVRLIKFNEDKLKELHV